MSVNNFNARITKAAKKHQCLACERPIAKGEIHIVYPGKNSEGKFMSTRLCIECSFLITQKTGANASNIRPGEFTDIRLPNCLRKKADRVPGKSESGDHSGRIAGNAPGSSGSAVPADRGQGIGVSTQDIPFAGEPVQS